MGELRVNGRNDPAAMRAFTRALLRDLHALEQLLDAGRIEEGVRRIGAEQELFLVDRGWRPAPVGPEVLQTLSNPCYTTEIGRFNLEINLPPADLGPGVFPAIERSLRQLIEEGDRAAAQHGAQVLLTGILPTLTHADLALENLSPRPRYFALNEMILALRGGPLQLRIEGTDELQIAHESVMLEACNTSFQVHLQVGAAEFPRLYNAAQAALGPVLAASANSPLLLGKRLWEETRIALFQQSIDTRHPVAHVREIQPRVRFGDGWVRGSVLEIFQQDLARMRVIFAGETTEDSLAMLAAGGVPCLRALQIHNSTVYRWNRPCYGVFQGKPHLRIECRALPAGPTLPDEVANAALWIGLVLGLAQEYGDVAERMSFDDARANFLAAARYGLRAGFSWLGGERLSAPELLLHRLLPLARAGLRGEGIGEEDVERYLGIIEQRVRSGRTGARWMLDAAARLEARGARAEQLARLTAGIAARQRAGTPVHEWEPLDAEPIASWQESYGLVEQCMTTSLLTVHEDELLDLVAFLMDRQQVRQILVEDDDHHLVGVVSYRSLLRRLCGNGTHGEAEAIPVREAMVRDPVCVSPETPTLHAVRLMQEQGLSALPVVRHGQLVGILSERDLLPIAAHVMATGSGHSPPAPGECPPAAGVSA